MDPFAPHLRAGDFRPEAYIAPDLPPRSAGAKPIPGSAREVDQDRRPIQVAHGETTVELEFADLLDVINPLQHIPVVGDIYRALTGDQISAPARVAGGAIFGGPVGFVSGIVNAIAADVAGQNLGEAVIAAVFGDGEALGDGEAGPVLAQAPAPAPASAAVPAAAPQVVAAALTPPGTDRPAQPLTGAAALQALGADLRVAKHLATPPADPHPSTAASTSAVSTSAAMDARHLVPSPRALFTDRMLDGLNRYKALVTRENTPPPPSGTAVDKVL